jgi:hypothetical protein
MLMDNISAGAMLHIAGVGVLFGLLLHPRFGPKNASAAGVMVLSIGIVIIGVAINVAFSGGSTWQQLTFQHVSYGSFFVALGYALALFSIRLMLAARRG